MPLEWELQGITYCCVEFTLQSSPRIANGELIPFPYNKICRLSEGQASLSCLSKVAVQPRVQWLAPGWEHITFVHAFGRAGLILDVLPFPGVHRQKLLQEPPVP